MVTISPSKGRTKLCDTELSELCSDDLPFKKLSLSSPKKFITSSSKLIPYSKIGNMRIHHPTSYKGRKSLLDTDNGHCTTSTSPGISGIIMLFWVSLVFYMAKLLVTSKICLSKLLQLELLSRSYADYPLFIVTIISISIYSLLIPFTYQLLQEKKIAFPSNCYWKTFLARHTMQNLPPLTILLMGNWREWPVVQMAVSLMYSLVLLMKVHSFLASSEAMDLQGKNDYLPSLADVALYFCYPTLVFELKYPRTDKRRWSYILDRTIGLLGIGIIFYIITETTLLPLVNELHEDRTFSNIIKVYFKLMTPCLLLGILSFFMIFEYVLNWAAEVTRFGDRHFYEDWWNSKDMADWARKWNLPVHRFLEKHVFKASINRWRFSKRTAQILTFVYSSVLHELVVGFALRKRVFCLFMMQMSQLPLMSLTRHLRVERYPVMGNCFWWTLMITGVPLIVIVYSVE